jgi:hypothetical protein
MSNLTLSLIRNSQVGTAAYVPSTDSMPLRSTPTTPVRRQPARGAYSPRIEMSRPSAPQIDLIKSLLADIIALDPEQGEKLRNLSNEAYFAGKLTPGWGNGASQHIDDLKEMRAALTTSLRATAPAHPRPTVPAGRYAVTAQEGNTAFYSVEVSDKGYYTVRLQVSDDFQKLDWGHSQSVLAQIEKDGPLAASMRYGKELGVCGVCQRTLTNESSRSLGIGPVCAQKMGS